MVGSTRQGLPSWIGAVTATKKAEFEQRVNKEDSSGNKQHCEMSKSKLSDENLGFGERAFSAAGAAFLSAIIVNPLDVAKTRLQAQAAGVPYGGLCSTACFDTNVILPEIKYDSLSSHAVVGKQPRCSPDCSPYKGTFDVFCKVVRQEGFTKLWRGTNASLALAIPSVGIYMPLYDIFRNYMEVVTRQDAPTLMPYIPLVAGSLARSIACVTCYPIELARTRMQAFKHSEAGMKPPGVWKTLSGVVSPLLSANNHQASLQNYRILWTGLGAQLARDVPFSAICWSSLEPLRRRILSSVGDEASVASVLGANFFSGVVAGSVAAGVTCPVDVARTRRQIEKDRMRALTMTTRQTLIEIWRYASRTVIFLLLPLSM